MEDCYIYKELSSDYNTVCGDFVSTTRHLPELLNFEPAVNDIFTRFVNLTSYIHRHFIHFVENLVLRDVYRFSQDAEVPSSDILICDGIVSESEENLCVKPNSEIVERKSGLSVGHSVSQRLMLPLFGFRLAWKLAFAWFRCSFIYIRQTQIAVRRFISSAKRTLYGSSSDIGWLQSTPGVPPVEDGTARFMELLHQIRNGEHCLPNSFVYLLIPGLFSNHSPLYFVSTKKFFSKMGLACHIAKIHSEASVEQNAWELKQYIEELYWGSGKRLMLLGHSKGGVDAAAALSIYWSELKDKVAGLALVQSPFGGTPIASDILREGQIADKEARRIMELLICKVIKGDMRALEDLTYEKRKEFVTKHKLPDQVPIISFHTEASTAPGVLASLSHIAHADLPLVSLPCINNDDQDSGQPGRKVPVVVPMAAAMAVCALHLRLRYGEKSDGLVTCRDAEVPGSVVIRPDQRLDHAWMVYSSWKRDTQEPDSSEMCEAILTLLVEIGNTKRPHSDGQ